jgi:hypothetical protein
MPLLRNYYIFVSHAWRYNQDYYNLIKLLNAAPNLQFRNYSVPTHNPLVDPATTVGQQRLASMLDDQIRPPHCLLVIAGMYANHRYWIDKEMAIAESYGKPMIGLIPLGQERVPAGVQDRCHEMVGWRTASIVDAMRRRAL